MTDVKVSLEKRAYDAVVEWLTKGRAGPGAPLPLRELAKELGMSRTPLRAAVGRLREHGLLAYDARFGFTVSIPTVADLNEAFDLRLMCEAHALQRFFDSSFPVVPAQLESIAREMSVGADEIGGDPERYAEFLRQDAEFHRALIRLASNARLEEWYDQLNLRIVIFCAGATVPFTDERFRVAADEHMALVEAIALGDAPVSRDRLSAHLQRVRDETIQRWRDSHVHASGIR